MPDFFIDNAKLEPVGDWSGPVNDQAVANLLAYSQAISLKRIADDLEALNAKLEATHAPYGRNLIESIIYGMQR